MGSLVIEVPAAWQVKQHDDNEPNQVNTRQFESEPFRHKIKAPAFVDDVLICVSIRIKHDDIDEPDEIKVAHIVKERHTAVNDKYVC